MISLAPVPFEQFATDRGYDVTPAVVPAENRVYADRQTQDAYEAWMAGGAHVVGMLINATFNTEAFREKIREFMGDA